MEEKMDGKGLPNVTARCIELASGPALGLHVPLGGAPLLLAATRAGYVMCGYLEIETASRLGDLAGRVTNVGTLEELLDAELDDVSDAARGMAEPGMTARAFLERISGGSDG